MRSILFVGLFVVSVSLANTEDALRNEESGVRQLADFSTIDAETDDEQFDVHRKRDSDSFYSRADRLKAANNRLRLRSNLSSSRGRQFTRHSSQINRPFNTYGPPSHQNSPIKKPGGGHGQRNRENSNQQLINNNNNNNNNNGLLNQGVPSPIRHVDFIEQSPIATQNNIPFGSNSANYLPPRNQKLPTYVSSADSFSPQQQQQSHQFAENEDQRANLHGQSQSLIENEGERQQQISDAAIFLAQNAEAIQQLYGAPAINQDFAPNSEEFADSGTNNQLQDPNSQFQELVGTTQSSQVFTGRLPAYASGTLNPKETLEQIQSLEKDRLILQLQRALAAQSSPEVSGRYDHNHANYAQNQKFLTSVVTEFPSFDKSTKFQGLTEQNSGSSLVSENLPLEQSSFASSTIGPPAFHAQYGASTTTQAPTLTTTTTVETSSGAASTQDSKNPTGHGSSQSGIGTAIASQPGFPVYGGFAPTYFTGTSFVPGLVGAVAPIPPVQVADAPTHFGIPFASAAGQRPSGTTGPPSHAPLPPASGPSFSIDVGTSTSPAISSTPSSVASSPHSPFVPINNVGSALQPIIPATSTHVQPVHIPAAITPVQSPTYGVQSVINPLLYKPVKAVYPVYYYPNVAYQIQKPVASAYPWSYVPSYAQVKPAQIWK